MGNVSSGIFDLFFTPSNASTSSNESSSSGNLQAAPAPVAQVVEQPLALAAIAFTNMMNDCRLQDGQTFWLGVKIFLLLTSFPANAVLMCSLLNRSKAMTPSEVLGLNVSVMDILYCLCLPLDIYSNLYEMSDTAHAVREGLFALNVFGCPLLLTFMCLERYVAAARPVVYLRLGRWEYRAVPCALAWILTLLLGLLGYSRGLIRIALPLSVTISLLFFVMLLCLLGIVWVLAQSGPGQASEAGVPLKRRALKNVLAVMAPSAVAYTPLVALVPYTVMIFLQNSSEDVSSEQCDVLYLLLVFPNVGLFIGPLFYLSRLRQNSCCSPKAGKQAQ